MGSSRSPLARKRVFLAAAAGVAGVYLMALAEAPSPSAPPVPPSAPTSQKAPEKPAPGDKSAATTSPTTSPTTQPSGATHTVKSGKLSFVVNGDGVFVAD